MTNSWGVKMSASVRQIVKTKIEPEIRKGISPGHTFTGTVNVPVPPLTEAFLDVRSPQYAHTGTFVAKVGNTTYELADVTFYSPVTDTNVAQAEWQPAFPGGIGKLVP